jgi:Protein of unknown function (DUF2795)
MTRWALLFCAEGAYTGEYPRFRLQEATMDFNPDEAQQYLEGADYPASKEDVTATAESNGAPEELVERIRALSTPEFSSADEVVTELRAFPQSS